MGFAGFISHADNICSACDSLFLRIVVGETKGPAAVGLQRMAKIIRG